MYFGIGIYHPKTETNVGTLMRNALIYDAQFVFTIGQRYKTQPSDTPKATLRLPYYAYETFDDFFKNMPKNCKLIGVELDEKAKKIEKYVHFKNSIYLLGAEDNGLPQNVLTKCHEIIQLPGKCSTNVASAGTIVMYDRHLKEYKRSI